MKVQRFILSEQCYEELESIGRLKFVGDPGIHDLTSNKVYECIGIRNNLLVMLDDTGDYYLFLPQDGLKILSGEAKGAGWVVVDDPSGAITRLFQVFDDKNKKVTLSKRFFSWLIKKRFEHLDRNDSQSNKS